MQQTYATVASPYAGFWRRFVAIIIDGLIVGIPLGIVFGVINVAADNTSTTPFAAARNSGLNGVESLIRLVVAWLYFALLESSSYQATVGKMALGIKVTDLNGNRISFGRATGRYFAKIISTIICFVGYIMAAFTSRKQALHDMIAGTLVMQKGAMAPAYAAPSPFYAPPPTSGFPAPPPPPAPPAGDYPPPPPPSQ